MIQKQSSNTCLNSANRLQASLALLEKSLPVRIGRATSYWITVQAR